MGCKYWKNVANESETSGSDGRVLVRRKSIRKNRCLLAHLVLIVEKQDVMVWGCMSNDGVGPLVIRGKCHWRKIPGHFAKAIFAISCPWTSFSNNFAGQQCSSTSSKCGESLEGKEQIKAQSPDLNSIQNLWVI